MKYDKIRKKVERDSSLDEIPETEHKRKPTKPIIYVIVCILLIIGAFLFFKLGIPDAKAVMRERINQSLNICNSYDYPLYRCLAVQTKNISLCNEIKSEGLSDINESRDIIQECNDAYHVYHSIYSKSITECNEIDNGNTRNFCLAIVTRNESFCDKIIGEMEINSTANISESELCISILNALKTGDVSENNLWIYDYYHLIGALESGNAELCGNIFTLIKEGYEYDSDKLKGECVAFLQEVDEDYCENSVKQACLDNYYFDLGVLESNTTKCEMIKDMDKKGVCLDQIEI